MCGDVVSVLVVEDEAITALDLKYGLLDLGYSVVDVVDTGCDAISVARDCCPSVVLMDIKLKGDMEGSDAAWVISELGIPVVFVSANSDADSMSEFSECESFAFISKPFDIEKLNRTILDILDLK